MRGKNLYLDTETTGLDATVNGVWQMSGLIEIDGIVKQEFDFRVAPFPNDVLEDKALEVGQVTEEQLRAFNPPMKVYKVLTTLFAKYIDKYDKQDKFTLIGYNVNFDDAMMRAWFKKLGDNYWGSWVKGYRLDVYQLVAYLNIMGMLKTETGKLKQEDVASALGIEYDAHNSLEDIRVTRKLLEHVNELFLKGQRACGGQGNCHKDG